MPNKRKDEKVRNKRIENKTLTVTGNKEHFMKSSNHYFLFLFWYNDGHLSNIFDSEGQGFLVKGTKLACIAMK